MVKRMIRQEDLEKVLSRHDAFELEEPREWGVHLRYLPDPQAHLMLVNGEIEATSPGDAVLESLRAIAEDLDAELLYEDEMPVGQEGAEQAPVREIVLFWPLVTLILLGLLIWKW